MIISWFNRHYLTRKAILMPMNAPWRHLLDSSDVNSFINITSLSPVCFAWHDLTAICMTCCCFFQYRSFLLTMSATNYCTLDAKMYFVFYSLGCFQENFAATINWGIREWLAEYKCCFGRTATDHATVRCTWINTDVSYIPSGREAFVSYFWYNPCVGVEVLAAWSSCNT